MVLDVKSVDRLLGTRSRRRCGQEDVPSMHQPVRHGIEVAVDGDVVVDVDPRHKPLADDKRRRR
jgi:hypothetical protein